VGMSNANDLAKPESEPPKAASPAEPERVNSPVMRSCRTPLFLYYCLIFYYFSLSILEYPFFAAVIMELVYPKFFNIEIIYGKLLKNLWIALLQRLYVFPCYIKRI
jgi:hypothetical protein